MIVILTISILSISKLELQTINIHSVYEDSFAKVLMGHVHFNYSFIIVRCFYLKHNY